MPRDNEEGEENTIKPTLCLKLFAEFLGTLGLAYTVAMTAASSGETGLAPVAVPVCAAAYLILMVYGIGSISGCNINPGVSTAVATWQAISGTNDNFLTDWLAYCIVQVIGGTIGAVLGASLWAASGKYEEFNPYGIFPYAAETQDASVAMFTEMLALFFFTFCILRTCCDHDKPPLATDGIVIGIALFTAIVGTAGVSGGGVNPAVATALRVANSVLAKKYEKFPEPTQGEGTFFLVYWVGPLIGGVLAAFAHYVFEVSTSKVFVNAAFIHDSANYKKKNTAVEDEV